MIQVDKYINFDIGADLTKEYYINHNGTFISLTRSELEKIASDLVLLGINTPTEEYKETGKLKLSTELENKVTKDETFLPKTGLRERYSLENIAKSEGMTIAELKENNKLRKKYKEKCIKSFMNHGMSREGAELQTLRKMNGCG